MRSPAVTSGGRTGQPGRHLICGLCWCGLVVLAGGADAAWGQCEVDDASVLLAADGAAEDWFGHSLDVYGDTIIVGAPWDDDEVTDSGSAYIYRFDGSQWVQEQKLLAWDAGEGHLFGASVSIYEDVALVGAIYADDNGEDSGAAYVFRYDGTEWVGEQKLLPDDGAEGDTFARSLDLADGVALIGAYLADANGVDSGAVYVFRFDGGDWVQEQRLLPDDVVADDRFGFHTDIAGDVIVADAFTNDNGADSGAVYVFRFDGGEWVQEEKLLPDDGEAGDWFGGGLSLSQGSPQRVVIGARRDGDQGVRSGSAYVFRLDEGGWVQEQKLLAGEGGGPEALFGNAVSIEGETVVVGAHGGVRPGSAYVFRFDGAQWVQQATLYPPDSADEDEFGKALVMLDEMVVIGARLNDEQGTDAGAVYLFGGMGDCDDNGTVDLCDLAEGTGTDVNGNGTLDECELCTSDAECDDGLFCTGAETCEDGVCLPGSDPCGPELNCDEMSDICFECFVDAGCDDGLFCTGVETCVDGQCESSGDPCSAEGQTCDEDEDTCVADEPPDDGDGDDPEPDDGDDTQVDGDDGGSSTDGGADSTDGDDGGAGDGTDGDDGDGAADDAPTSSGGGGGGSSGGGCGALTGMQMLLFGVFLQTCRAVRSGRRGRRLR